MENLDADANERPSPLGYIAAIVISALGHVALAVLVFFVLPGYLRSDRSPQTFSVKVVDQIPAGDLGTHLPRLSSQAHHRSASTKPPEPAPEEPQVASKPPPPPPPENENDKNAIALNTSSSPLPIATPTPTPEPTPAPSTPAPTATAKPHKHEPKPQSTHWPKAELTPEQSERLKPKANPTVVIAEAERTPSVEEQLNKLRERLLAEHLKERPEAPSDENAAAEPGQAGGGPVVADRATEGQGMGVGPGTGSAGIQQDPEFLLYYQTVQGKVKKAWSFSGGAGDLTTTVTFAIGPDGGLAAVKITRSSHDAAFDDSVIRAIRRAAPFPPPPEKYRSDFAQGVEAVFKLGELSS